MHHSHVGAAAAFQLILLLLATALDQAKAEWKLSAIGQSCSVACGDSANFVSQPVTDAATTGAVFGSIGYQCAGFPPTNNPSGLRPAINNNCQCFYSTAGGSTANAANVNYKRLCCCNGGDTNADPNVICPTTGLTTAAAADPAFCPTSPPLPPPPKGWVLTDGNGQSCDQKCQPQGGTDFCEAGQINMLSSESLVEDVLGSIGTRCDRYNVETTGTQIARPQLNDNCSCFYSTTGTATCAGGVSNTSSKRLCCCNGGDTTSDPETYCPTTGLGPVDGSLGFCDRTVSSEKPSEQPSELPSEQPSELPSYLPSTTPSNEPSSFPSDTPSQIPSSEPSSLPSLEPSAQPSIAPSMSVKATKAPKAGKGSKTPKTAKTPTDYS